MLECWRVSLNSYDIPAIRNHRLDLQDTAAVRKAELFAERRETIPGENVFQNPGEP